MSEERFDDRVLNELRGFEHDLLHELSTIAVLAELVGLPGLPAAQRSLHGRLLIREIKWLRTFVREERTRLSHNYGVVSPAAEIRLDVLLADVVATARLMSTASMRVTVEPVTVCAERIALGRALRNLMWNAIDAAAPDGEVRVRVRAQGDAAVVEIENDVRHTAATGEHVGLSVVRHSIAPFDGVLRTETGAGTYRVTVVLPTAATAGGERCAS